VCLVNPLATWTSYSETWRLEFILLIDLKYSVMLCANWTSFSVEIVEMFEIGLAGDMKSKLPLGLSLKI